MSIEFDGIDQQVSPGNPSQLDFGTGDWTISAWYKTTDTGQIKIYAKGGDFSGGIRASLSMGESAAGELETIVDDNTTKVVVGEGAATNDGNWHHGAAVRDGSTLRLYRDGVERNTGGLPGGYDLSGMSQREAHIGAIRRQDTGAIIEFFDGEIEDVRVYGRALSPAEIQTIYATQGADGIVDGLIAGWPLDEGAEGATASGADSSKDIGTNDLDGTPNNSPVYRGSERRFRRRTA